jgi:predicted Zn-dependent protease
MWFCRSRVPDVTIFCEEKNFPGALERAGGASLAAQFQLLARRRQEESQQRFRLWGAVSLGLALLLGGAYLALRGAGGLSVELLPRSVDQQLGELALEHMDLEGPVLEDAVLQKDLASILRRLAPKPSNGFTFHLRVVDAPIVNAFALPGGEVVVYTGLIRATKTAEELAGVLAHEISHVTRRHGLQRIVQSVGVVAGIQLVFGDVSGVAAVAVEALRQGAINRYSREHEHQADMDAVKTLAKANINPLALADFFALLQKRGEELPTMIAWLGTHPELAQRIADVKAAAKQAPVTPGPALISDFAELQRHAGRMP